MKEIDAERLSKLKECLTKCNDLHQDLSTSMNDSLVESLEKISDFDAEKEHDYLVAKIRSDPMPPYPSLRGSNSPSIQSSVPLNSGTKDSGLMKSRSVIATVRNFSH